MPHPHLTEGETEAQKDEASCSRSVPLSRWQPGQEGPASPNTCPALLPPLADSLLTPSSG